MISENIFGHENDDDCLYCETGKIVLKVGKYGEFYGCSNFPRCSGKPGKGKSAVDEFLKRYDK